MPDQEWLRPSSIWLVDENNFDKFILGGAKVVLIAEDPGILANHPSVVTGGCLLPSIEALTAELDGDIPKAEFLYQQELTTSVQDKYIAIILAAAVSNVTLGIMFGKDEKNMHFPTTLINFLYQVYGLIVGVDKGANTLYPDLMVDMLPIVLAKLYLMDIISMAKFIMLHPDRPIHEHAIQKLIYELNPPVKQKTLECYEEYFHDFIESCKSKGALLVDPLVGL